MMGIGFDIQESSEILERSHWDVPLNAIITESGMRRFPSNR
jgi:5-formyltetrahydrofolate cyclo-ligase